MLVHKSAKQISSSRATAWLHGDDLHKNVLTGPWLLYLLRDCFVQPDQDRLDCGIVGVNTVNFSGVFVGRVNLAQGLVGLTPSEQNRYYNILKAKNSSVVV